MPSYPPPPRAPINPPNSTTLNPYSCSDQDFYCSFTNLPNMPTTNLDELPYTIYSPYSLDRMRERLYRNGQPQHQFPGYERPSTSGTQKRGGHQRSNSRDHVSSFHSVASRGTSKSGKSTTSTNSSGGASFWSIWSMSRGSTDTASTAATSVATFASPPPTPKARPNTSASYYPHVENIDTDAPSNALTTTRCATSLSSYGPNELDYDYYPDPAADLSLSSGPPKKKRRTVSILKGASSWLPGLSHGFPGQAGKSQHDTPLNVAATGILLKSASRKPSTLDFRCIGTMDEMVARKSVETLSMMGIPAMKEICAPEASSSERERERERKRKEDDEKRMKEEEEREKTKSRGIGLGLGRLKGWAKAGNKLGRSKKRDSTTMEKCSEKQPELMDVTYDAPKLDWIEPEVGRDSDWRQNWFSGID